jgi:hypothetical protein
VNEIWLSAISAEGSSIPRRTLRFLAANGRPALIATMLAQMIRCVWWNEGRCDTEGSCSSRFVADVFEVDERNVKRARAELRRMGWLTIAPCLPWHINAHGARAAINLAWSRAKTPYRLLSAGGVNSRSPPPPAPIVSKSPPPIDKHNLPSGSKNHNPACSGPLGVRERTENPGKPRLNRVVPGDLHSAARLDSLFKQAVADGLVHNGFAERLHFFAAAEHALRVGKRTTCGLFVAVLRGGLWRFISQADEGRALDRVKRLTRWQAIANSGIPMGRKSIRVGDGIFGETSGRGGFVIGLVRELARLRSFDGVGRGARNRPPCDDLTVAAA